MSHTLHQTVVLKHITAFGMLGITLLAIVLTSCASLSPQQESDNSVTRREQRADGVQDPMKQK